MALAAVILLFAGGGYYLVVAKPPQGAAPSQTPARSAADAGKTAHAEAEELARLRAEKAARDQADAEAAAPRQKAAEEARQKAAADAATRQQIEEQARQKLEAEIAAKQKGEAEARQKAQEDAEARRKAEEDDRRAAEAAEGALHLSPLDRQHVQVSLTALGFNTNGSDGVFGSHTRDMIAAWQKSRSFAGTGFLTGPQNQALLRDAAPAIQRFDDDEKRAQEAKKKADEDKAKSEAAAAAKAAPVTPVPPVASASAGPDGLWRGSYHCTASRHGSEFDVGMQIHVAGGTGTWVRPGSGSSTKGNKSITLKIAGNQVIVQRVYIPNNNPNGAPQTATMAAQLNGNAISGSGPEANSGGRTCDILLDRTSH